MKIEAPVLTSVSGPLCALALYSAATCINAADRPDTFYLRLPVADERALGQIEKLSVTVDCGWIDGLRRVPELYNIEMKYDIPTSNVFVASPRLGAAAVTISQWSGVVGVRLPRNADSKSCFKVVVVAEGREGIVRQWGGTQLRLPK